MTPPGGGPRHMKFHPNGKWAYVLNELSLSVTVYDYMTPNLEI
jgi:6-phosphogluconolactonase